MLKETREECALGITAGGEDMAILMLAAKQAAATCKDLSKTLQPHTMEMTVLFGLSPGRQKGTVKQNIMALITTHIVLCASQLTVLHHPVRTWPLILAEEGIMDA